MQPEWSGDPEVPGVFLTILIAGAVAFLLFVLVFAFYW
jgi:hypothetical protein